MLTKISPLLGLVSLVMQVFCEHNVLEPNYQYQYQINEPDRRLEFGHEEERVGNTAEGKYHVLLPDGRTQKVNYTADESGYNVDIYYDKSLYSQRDNYGHGYLYGQGSHHPVGSQQTPSAQSIHPFKTNKGHTVDTMPQKKVYPSNKNPSSPPSPSYFSAIQSVDGLKDMARAGSNLGYKSQYAPHQSQINQLVAPSLGTQSSQRPTKPTNQDNFRGHSGDQRAASASQSYVFHHGQGDYEYTPSQKLGDSINSKTWAASDKYSKFVDPNYRPQKSSAGQIQPSEKSKSSFSHSAGILNSSGQHATADERHSTGDGTHSHPGTTWDGWTGHQYTSGSRSQQLGSENLRYGSPEMSRQKYLLHDGGEYPNIVEHRHGIAQAGHGLMSGGNMCICPCQGA